MKGEKAIERVKKLRLCLSDLDGHRLVVYFVLCCYKLIVMKQVFIHKINNVLSFFIYDCWIIFGPKTISMSSVHTLPFKSIIVVGDEIIKFVEKITHHSKMQGWWLWISENSDLLTFLCYSVIFDNILY